MANLNLSPRKWAAKLLLIKTETTYGTDAIPSATANYVEARNLTFTAFDAETADRKIETPTMGNGGKLVTSTWAKLSFDVAFVPGGALGTAPQWGPILLACGFAQTLVATTSVTYNLVSANVSSVTAYINIDGIFYKFVGCRGDVKVTMSAKGIPTLKFDLTAQYAAPVDTAMPTPTKTGWMVEEAVQSLATSAVTLNGTALALSTLDFGTGNKISKIDLPGPQREIVLSDRAPTASLTVLAPSLAVFNPYPLADSNTAMTLSLTHGSTAGNKITSTLKGVISTIAEDQVDGMAAYKLNFMPIPVTGNDEITLLCI